MAARRAEPFEARLGALSSGGPGEGILGTAVQGHVARRLELEATRSAAEIDAVPDRAVERFDPGVRLVAHEPRRHSERERRHDERERAVPADALLGERELLVELRRSARLRPLVGRREGAKVLDERRQRVARTHTLGKSEALKDLVRGAFHVGRQGRSVR